VEEDKIKPTMTVPTEAGHVFPEMKSIVFSCKIVATNLNGYKIFVIQFLNSQDLCGDTGHYCHFLRNESHPAEPASPILFSTD
jgi:hypothetical protein